MTTTPKETCPKCGSPLVTNVDGHLEFACTTQVAKNGLIYWEGYRCILIASRNSARCRITELEKENERLREAMIGLRQQIGCGCGSGDLASLCKTCRVADYNASTLLAKGGKTE
jgi:hypothetical protein